MGLIRNGESQDSFLTHLDFNSKLFISSKGIIVGQGQQPDLIQGIGSIRDQFSKEDL